MALTTFQSFVASNPRDAQRVLNHAWLARGAGTNDFYFVEVDPTTGAFPITISSSTPRTKAWNVAYNYAGGSVTTGAYTEILSAAANTAASTRLLVFDGSGQVMKIATGALGAEVDQFYISPGGWDAPVEISIASGVRVSVRAVSDTASAGYLVIAAFS